MAKMTISTNVSIPVLQQIRFGFEKSVIKSDISTVSQIKKQGCQMVYLISYQKPKFEYVVKGLGVKNSGFVLEYITTIWYILRPLGNFVAVWYIFPPLWYFVSGKIWQSCKKAD
jgi:hypothetical protein